MNIEKLYPSADEKPLDSFPVGISSTAIFRKIAFIGDSLSSGEFESRDAEGNPGYHDYYEHSWGQYIARKNGLTAYNFSKGGMTAKKYLNGFADEQGFWDPALAAEAYVLALGVNDVINWGMEIGSPDDVGTDRETFCRYYGEIIARYQAMQPRAKFFFLTMPRGGDPERDEKRRLFAEAIYGMAARFENSYVIDLYRYGPVYDAAFKAQFYLYGHMNASGYILTANMVDAYIDYIVRHNPDDFRRVGFIGTDLY